MSNIKHGKVSWGDKSLKTGDNKGGKDLWMRLKTGSNLVRILTEPHIYHTHKYKIDGDKSFGRRIPCAKPNSCVVCEKGDKAKKRYYLGVIDRSTNTYKILDVSWSVLSDVQMYVNDTDWGDATEYDFDIVVNPKGGPQDYYKTVAKPKRPLSANDMSIQERDVDLEYLEKRCTPPESSVVQSIFDKYQAEVSASNDSTSSSISSPDFTDADDTEFPDASSSLPF